MHITIQSPVTGNVVIGKEIKRYQNGLTVEDPKGVIHYVSYDRVLSDSGKGGRIIPEKKLPTTLLAGVTKMTIVDKNTNISSNNTLRKSAYLPKHGVCPITGRALNSDGTVRAVRGSKKK